MIEGENIFNELAIFLIVLVLTFIAISPYIKSQDCTEYKQGERLYLELINQTTNGILSKLSCNITFFDITHNAILNNVTTTEIAGTGLYYFALNGSFSNNSMYLATAYCSYEVVNNYEFCIVQNSTRDLNVQTNTNIITLASNLTQYQGNISTNFTLIQNILNSFENHINSNFTILPAKVWEYPSRNLTWYNGTGIAVDIWNYGTRTLTSFGTLIVDIWAYGTRTLTDFGDLVMSIWEYTPRNTTISGINAVDIWEYEPRNVTGGGGTNNYNTTLNLILPVS